APSLQQLRIVRVDEAAGVRLVAAHDFELVRILWMRTVRVGVADPQSDEERVGRADVGLHDVGDTHVDDVRDPGLAGRLGKVWGGRGGDRGGGAARAHQ